jgi:1-acyl-sn-glycerol-3-phosphate acyltransferase
MHENGTYRTDRGRVSAVRRWLPSVYFYTRLFLYILRGSYRGWRGRYFNEPWLSDSLGVLRALEGAGVGVEVTGTDNLRAVDGPCVFVANHMSTLETLVLPSFILPVGRVTFVLKRSLLRYPVFRHLLLAIDPIEVGRESPREDLKAVLDGGSERLRAGTSVIVFPQTTRSTSFDPGEFNTIGVKLAARAGVPLVPVALKTDAWGTGKILRDMGRIDPSKAVRFSFGEPMRVRGRGREEHERTIRFIQEKLGEWESDRPTGPKSGK